MTTKTWYSPEGYTAAELQQALAKGNAVLFQGNREFTKRKPLLVDQYLALKSPGMLASKYHSIIRSKLVEAKRFVLDEQATRYIGEFIYDLPDAIAYAQEFAIPPFETMYIEVPARTLWHAANPHGILDADSDITAGYLYVGPHVYVLCETSGDYAGKVVPDLKVGALPVRYQMNQPLSIEFESELIKMSKVTPDMIDNYMWGSAYDRISEQYKTALRANHSMKWIWDKENYTNHPVVMQSLMEGSAGDMRNIIAFLLFFNQSSKVRINSKEVPHKHGLIGNKASTFIKHTVITLHVAPQPRLKEYYGTPTQSAWRREHDVRGHFCRNERARTSGCNTNAVALHEWNEVGVSRWRCLKCGGLMWWKDQFHRGHKEKGKVKSEYAVTK